MLVLLAGAAFGCAKVTSSGNDVDASVAGDGASPPGDGASGLDLTDVDATSACVAACTGAHESCFQGQCTCDAGFARTQNAVGGAKPCVVDTAIHTQIDVCNRYKSSGTLPPTYFTKTAATCDPGSLTIEGMASALSRVNFFRWLVGLPQQSTDPTQNLQAQKCALVTASNPVNGSTVHNPPPSYTCYTADGATSAGVSNIAYSPVHFIDAMELWIADTSNSTDLGNRRSIFRRELNPIGIGLYQGGTLGSAACLQRTTVTTTIGDTPDFVAYPPPGFVPIQLANHIWSFSWPMLSTKTPIAAKVVRASDNANLAVNVATLLVNSPWEDAISIRPNGWSPAAGETYRVTVTASTLTWTYDIKPVTCP